MHHHYFIFQDKYTCMPIAVRSDLGEIPLCYYSHTPVVYIQRGSCVFYVFYVSIIFTEYIACI